MEVEYDKKQDVARLLAELNVDDMVKVPSGGLFDGLDPKEPVFLQVMSKKDGDPGKWRIKFMVWAYDVPVGTYKFQIKKPAVEVPAIEMEVASEQSN